DIDPLVEPLRDAHRMRGRKAELAARFLLQGRGGERSGRIAPRRLGLDVGDRETGALQRLFERFGLACGADAEALDFLTIGTDEAGLDLLSPRRGQRRNQ